MSEATLDALESALLARKGEATPADARQAPGIPQPARHPLTESEDAIDGDSFDLNSLIRRRGPNGAGSLPAFQVDPSSGTAQGRSRPDILPLALLARGAVGDVTTEARGHGSVRHAGNGQSSDKASRSSKRRQLTLRLWPDEFDRLRAVATIAHTSYQEILASAAVIFLDHVLPHGAPADEESIADGWHRLKNGEL
jgi:hypothetical protein